LVCLFERRLATGAGRVSAATAKLQGVAVSHQALSALHTVNLIVQSIVTGPRPARGLQWGFDY